MKVKIQPPSYRKNMLLDIDVVEAYVEALQDYACEDKIRSKCDKDCFCDFIEDLQSYDKPPMTRSDIAKFARIAKMTPKQQEELYVNYVHCWADEQTHHESMALLEAQETATPERELEIWKEWQELEKETNRTAEAIIAR